MFNIKQILAIVIVIMTISPIINVLAKQNSIQTKIKNNIIGVKNDIETVKLEGSIIAKINDTHSISVSPSINLADQEIKFNTTNDRNEYSVNSILKIDVDVEGNTNTQSTLGGYCIVIISIFKENGDAFPLNGLTSRIFNRDIVIRIIDVLSDDEKCIEIPLQYTTSDTSEKVSMNIRAIGIPPGLLTGNFRFLVSKKINLNFVYSESVIEAPVTTKEYGSPKYQTAEGLFITSDTPIYLNTETSEEYQIHYRVWYNSEWTNWMTGDVNQDIVLTMNDLGEPFTEDCKHYIEYYAVDNFNNTEETHNQTFYVDNTPPITTKEYGSPKWENSSGTFITTYTPIYLNATDPGICAVGHYTIYYRIGYYYEEWTWTNWENGSANQDVTFTMNDLGNSWDSSYKYYIEYYAVDCLGNKEETQNQTFLLMEETNQIPTLESPADGSIIADNTTTLKWNGIENQSNYRLQYADNIDFTNATTVDVSNASEYTIGPLEDGIYYWHVAVLYTEEVGEYSDTWSFVIDTQPPETTCTLEGNILELDL